MGKQEKSRGFLEFEDEFLHMERGHCRLSRGRLSVECHGRDFDVVLDGMPFGDPVKDYAGLVGKQFVSTPEEADVFAEGVLEIRGERWEVLEGTIRVLSFAEATRRLAIEVDFELENLEAGGTAKVSGVLTCDARPSGA